MTKAFLRRPILAIVCSVVILIAGLVVIPGMPIAQYPQIAPPVVTITAIYTGASPQAVESQVTTPIEQAVNTVQGLRYVSSTSAQGVSTVTCTFELGVNLDIAAADVQNLVQSSLGQLPQTVQQVGVTVAKNSGTFVMGVALTSDSKNVNTLDLSNYAQLNVVNNLSRVQGVSGVIIFGQRQYAMRVWLNPAKLQQEGLDSADVVSALQEQNAEVAAGSIGSPPTPKNQPYTYPVNALTQLSDPTQFANIILRANPNGGYVRLGDVSRVELGAQTYTSALRFDGHAQVVGLGVQQYPTANALEVSKGVRQQMLALAPQFPSGVNWEVAFDATTFVNESIKEVVITLGLSIFLVILVIFIFLQNPKSTLIPAATIPVSLVGTFFLMQLFGFTINTITLFGLTLATGLVVDDAIVVIENIARHMEMNKGKKTAVESAGEAMAEVQSAVVASSLVLLAVFVPVAFTPGTVGLIYKQFAMTIAAAITISLFQALTLAPVLSARFLAGETESTWPFFVWFNRGLQRFRDWYQRALPGLFRRRWIVAGGFAAALLVTFFLSNITPNGFIPDEDVGYFIILVQTPEGTSLEGEQAISKQAEAIVRAQPEVQHLFDVGGFSFSGAAPNRGVMFALLTPWGDRETPAWCQLPFVNSQPVCTPHNVQSVIARINYALYSKIANAQIFAFNPPAINGLGFVNGFQFELEDRGNIGLPALMGQAYGIMGAAAQDKRLQGVFTQFAINSPQIEANIDRNKAKAIGISLDDVFTEMEVELGSLYVNNFTYLNRSWQVIVQGDAPYRNDVDSLQGLYVHSSSAPGTTVVPSGVTASADGSATASTTVNGAVMTPLSALMTAQKTLGPPVISHYNLYRNIELQGSQAPGASSGDAIIAMSQIAGHVLKGTGSTYEWTGLQLDQLASGQVTGVIFALGIIFVFLTLSAQYESFIDPVIVLLAVPAALLGALGFMNLRHFPIPFLFDPNLSQDVYARVGYLMLIGLASKSAILIVEFANQQLREGATIIQAALRGAQTRLRPILMTSIAFIIAVLPLVFASGAGSEARHSIGTVVFGGMLVSTFLNLGITPVLYVIVKSLEPKRTSTNGKIIDPGHTDFSPSETRV